MSLLTIKSVELRTREGKDPAVYFVTGDVDGAPFEGAVTFKFRGYLSDDSKEKLVSIQNNFWRYLNYGASSVTCRVVACIRHGQSLRLPYLIDLNQRLPSELGISDR